MNEDDYEKVCKQSKVLKGLSDRDKRIYLSMGLAEEANEVTGLFKKDLFYDLYHMDTRHLKEELGDTLHYLTLLIRECGWTMEEIRESNAKKVLARNKHKI